MYDALNPYVRFRSSGRLDLTPFSKEEKRGESAALVPNRGMSITERGISDYSLISLDIFGETLGISQEVFVPLEGRTFEEAARLVQKLLREKAELARKNAKYYDEQLKDLIRFFRKAGATVTVDVKDNSIIELKIFVDHEEIFSLRFDVFERKKRDLSSILGKNYPAIILRNYVKRRLNLLLEENVERFFEKSSAEKIIGIRDRDLIQDKFAYTRFIVTTAIRLGLLGRDEAFSRLQRLCGPLAALLLPYMDSVDEKLRGSPWIRVLYHYVNDKEDWRELAVEAVNSEGLRGIIEVFTPDTNSSYLYRSIIDLKEIMPERGGIIYAFLYNSLKNIVDETVKRLEETEGLDRAYAMLSGALIELYGRYKTAPYSLLQNFSHLEMLIRWVALDLKSKIDIGDIVKLNVGKIREYDIFSPVVDFTPIMIDLYEPSPAHVPHRRVSFLPASPLTLLREIREAHREKTFIEMLESRLNITLPKIMHLNTVYVSDDAREIYGLNAFFDKNIAQLLEEKHGDKEEHDNEQLAQQI